MKSDICICIEDHTDLVKMITQLQPVYCGEFDLRKIKGRSPNVKLWCIEDERLGICNYNSEYNSTNTRVFHMFRFFERKPT